MKGTKSRYELSLCAIALLSCIIIFARCGDGGDGNGDAAQDPDAAEDVLVEDTQAEVPHDPPVEDGVADPPAEEAASDPQAEDPAAEDAATDPAEEDAAADATDEDGTSPGCAALGGTCTDFRWVLCPTGLEPAAETPHSDCPPDGWCCVDAPASPCSDESNYDCVVGDSCADLGEEWGPCWGTPTEDFACEAGRVCCMDICF